MQVAHRPQRSGSTQRRGHALRGHAEHGKDHGCCCYSALPHAQAFERTTQALTPAIGALCTANALAQGQTALAGARTAWRDATQTWEQLSAVAIGAVIEHRSPTAPGQQTLQNNHF